MRGSHENGDIFFQNREASNRYYDALPWIVEEYMDRINQKLGTDYALFNYYGAENADRVIIAMGSVCDAAEEVVDYLNARGGKCGFLQVHLFRPFSAKHFLAALPETVKKIAVLDRCKEMGSAGEPLFQDVCTVNEIASLSQRFAVAKMLMQKRTYLEIAQKTGASTATISRVNRALVYGNDGYSMVLDRISTSDPD
jgi:pyruvate-ferredoxin/flavodoxin oxidoreductase